MRRAWLSVVLLVSAVFATAPAEAAYTYSASLTVTPSNPGPGALASLKYSLSSNSATCPTSEKVRFYVDSTIITSTALLDPETCSATATYTIPHRIQCGQHGFQAGTYMNDAPALIQMFHIQCPNTPGGILWGRQHGTAAVHQVVAFDAPRVPTTAWVNYYWKIGNTYTSAHTTRFTIPWSANGKYVYGVVKVTENSTQTYWHSYRYGPVTP